MQGIIMYVQIVARGSPNDQFFYNLFIDCLDYIPNDSKVYYVWAEPLILLESMLANLDYNSPNVYLFIPDDLTDRCFIYGKDQQSYISRILSTIISDHPSTKFTVVTDVANLSDELDGIKFINSDFAALNELEYRAVDPVINKDLNRAYTLLIGRPARSRISTLCYLQQQDLLDYGQILIGKETARAFSQFDDYLSMINWVFTSDHEFTIKPKLVQGFNLAKLVYKDSLGFGMTGAHKNYENLDLNLRQYYSNSPVEIICETYYEEPSLMITEKTLHSIYGCSFLIWISSTGTVNYLEQLGVDVFRDIVDHNYDSVTDPVDRLVTAIDDNRRLLTDLEYTKKLWTNSKDRFLSNVNFMKYHLHNQIRDRIISAIRL
jgi:hypothetical protein